MSSQDFRTTQSAPAYQEMVSEYPLRERLTPMDEMNPAEPQPAASYDAHAASPSPPPSQATPQSSPKKSQVIVEPSTGALSILANEISFDQDAEEDVFNEAEPDDVEEPKPRRKSFGKERTQPTIEVEEEQESTAVATSASTLPSGTAKRTSRRVAVTKTVSKITLSNLLKAKLIAAGEDIVYKDEEAIILGDGWIEHGDDKYPDPETWVHDFVRQGHGRLRDLPKDAWSEIYYGDQTLAEIREAYIRDGFSEREERKGLRLSRLPTDERKMYFGDDDSSSEYDDRRRHSRSFDNEEDEEIVGDSDDMQVDNDRESLLMAESDEEELRARKKRQNQKKKSTPTKSPKKAATTPTKKRKREESEAQSNEEGEEEFQEEKESPAKRPKTAASASAPKRVVSEIDSGIFAESPSIPQEPRKKQPQRTDVAKKQKSSKPDEQRPPSLEMVASSLSTGADSLDDFLTSQGQEIQPIVRPRARVQAQEQPARKTFDDDEPWVDTTAPHQAAPKPVVPQAPTPSTPTKAAAASSSSPRKPAPIKREPTLQLPEVMEIEDEGAKPTSRRKSTGGISRRSSSGSGEDFDEAKQKQRKIDEIFVKAEEDHATVAERMHKQFDEAEANQPTPKRTPSAAAMPPPAAHPRVKKAAPQAQSDAPPASHYISNGPGPIIVASALKTHNLGQIKLLVSKFGGELRGELTKDVTHLVVLPTDGVASRTIKYLQAVAIGAWVLSFQWILDSLKEQKYLPEAEYEIKGDSKASGAPAKSRSFRKKGKLLLEGYEVHFHGSFPPGKGPKLEDLKALVKLAGAAVIRAAPEPPKDIEEARVLRKLIIAHESCPESEAKRVWEETGYSPVTYIWLFDTISFWKPLDTADYRIYVEVEAAPDYTQNSLAF